MWQGTCEAQKDSKRVKIERFREDEALGLQILIAGCPADERFRVESTVRRAVGQRAEEGAWSISLVRLGSEWQVTIDGPAPPLRGVSLTVPEIRLQNAIVEAISKSHAAAGGPSGPMPTAAPPSSSRARAISPSPVSSAGLAGETRDRHECSKCGQGFVVVYARQPGEATTKAPVACPKCWQVTHVPVASEAAQHEDYRAEAV